MTKAAQKKAEYDRTIASYKQKQVHWSRGAIFLRLCLLTLRFLMGGDIVAVFFMVAFYLEQEDDEEEAEAEESDKSKSEIHDDEEDEDEV